LDNILTFPLKLVLPTPDEPITTNFTVVSMSSVVGQAGQLEGQHKGGKKFEFQVARENLRHFVKCACGLTLVGPEHGEMKILQYSR
jgi:hypothetical protein